MIFGDQPEEDPHGECRYEIERLQAEVERLRAIVAKLPKTADGVPVVPGMIIIEPSGKPLFCNAVYSFPAAPQHNMYSDCFSTIEAAAVADEIRQIKTGHPLEENNYGHRTAKIDS